MPTEMDYAALAAHVYNDQRGGGPFADANKLDTPVGWKQAELLGFSTGESLNVNPFSATAGAYVNTATGEIVIAYKGTDFLVELSSRAWNTAADLAADVGLATNLGRLGIGQQLHAAIYYLAVKDWAVENGYDPSKISFTGHSLGGGLAANMAVWFEREAVTFAAGPFKASATDPIAFAAAAAAIPGYAALFAASDAITEEIVKLTGAALHFSERASRVRNHYVRGEFLSYLRSDGSTVAGQGIPIDIGEQPFERKMDLHSMNLHLALKADARLVQAARSISELIPTLIDKTLYWKDPNLAQEDFVTRLVADQVRGDLTRQDGLLGKFTSDVLRLQGQQGIAVQSPIRTALVAAAMEYYLKKDAASATQLFRLDAGGVHFKYSDIGAASYKSLSRLQAAVESLLSTAERGYASRLLLQNAWHLQLGTEPLSWTADAGEQENDAAIGGTGNDALDSGRGFDILVGGNGSDKLTGGTGNDTLLGGAGSDQYVFTTGDGNDTVLDSDGQGSIRINGTTLTGGVETSDGSGTWGSNDQSVVYTLVTNGDGTQTLDIAYAGGSNHVYVRHFSNGRLGIWLKDASVVQAPADRLIEGDRDFGADGGAQDDLGNPVGNFTPGSGEYLYGGAGNDRIRTLGGKDVARGYGGNDTLEGGEGSDIMVGGAGNDRVYGNSALDLEQAIAAGANQTGSGLKGDWLNGGSGDDIVVGGTDNDALFGAHGSDVLVGGGGDDYLNGDDDFVATTNGFLHRYRPEDFDWSISAGESIFRRSSNGIYIESPAGGGADLMHAGAGNDFAFGGAGNDVIHGEGGNDTLVGYLHDDMLFGGAGDDTLTGDDGTKAAAEAGNDYIEGGAGNDWMQGEGGNDTLLGGADNDEIWGDAQTYSSATTNGHDHLEGGDGDDKLVGQGGNDDLFGGTGNDELFGDADAVAAEHQGADYLDGGDGDDYLRGYGGHDTMFGGKHKDTLAGESGNDYLDGQEGDDILDGGAGHDELFGGADHDVMRGQDGNDYLDGEDGNDTLEGGAEGDILFGGSGADQLLGEKGQDELYGEDGDDLLSGGEDNDLLVGDAGNDQILGEEGNDTLEGGTGADTLWGDAGNDVLRGGDGINHLEGGTGDDVLVGGIDADTLLGGQGNDTLDGASGHNYLDGGSGHNTYILQDEGTPASGNARTTIATSGGTATLVFTAGVTPDSLAYLPAAGDSDFALQYGSGDIVYIHDGLKANVISEVRFADGTVWSRAQLMAIAPAVTVTGGGANDDVQGGAQGDTLAGGAGDDRVNGGQGADLLSGGEGSDTYGFHRGDGEDRIDNAATDHATATDVIELGPDIAAGDVQVLRSGNDLTLRIADDRLTVADYFASADRKIDKVLFADGSWWDQAALEARATLVIAAGTDSGNNIQGSTGDDEIHGLGGDDVIYGKEGNDRLFGDGGADLLVGNAGDDYLDGGGGVGLHYDNLQGGAGSDTYYFTKGYGELRILEGAAAGDVDTLVLGPDITPGEVELYRDGTTPERLDLEIVVGRMSGQVIKVTGFFGTEGDRRIERIAFADGTIWTSQQVFDLLEPQGTGGNDSLVGFSWADSLEGTAGNDTFEGFAGNDTLRGGHGTDVLRGGAGNDFLDGGSGNDDLVGGLGADTYFFDYGYGRDVVVETSASPSTNDILQLGAGLTAEDITLFQHGTSLVLHLDGTTDELWLVDHFDTSADKRIETVVFGDGTTPVQLAELPVLLQDARKDMVGTAGDDIFVIGNLGDTITEAANQGVDTVQSHLGWQLSAAAYDHIENLTLTGVLGVSGWGNALDNLIQGNAGHNALSGVEGNDTLLGGAGNDVLRGGTGADRLDGDDGHDKLEGDEDADSLDGGSGNDTLLGGAGKDTLVGGSGDDGLFAGDELGNVQGELLDAGAGNDTLQGGASDTLIGGAGDDVYRVSGYAHSAVVVESAGEGTDTIICAWGTGASELAFGVENLTIAYDISRMNPEILNGNGLDNRLVAGSYGATLDGRAGADTMVGGSGSDTFHVDQAGDVVVGNGGMDTVISAVSMVLGSDVENLELAAMGGITDGTGNALHNRITGNVNSNVLDGREGDDTLAGNQGRDTLVGGTGSDTYVISQYMSGYPVVIENAASDHATATDTVELPFARTSYSFEKQGEDLVITDAATQASVVVRGHYAAGGQGAIDRIRFADTTLESAVFAGIAHGGSGTVTGTDYHDSLTAQAGGATLVGGAGNDALQAQADGSIFGITFEGGTGSDIITGSYAADTYVFRRGDGKDVFDDDVRSLNPEVAAFFERHPNEASYQDLLDFRDIASSQVSVRRPEGSNDLVLIVAGGQDEVLIRDWFDGTMLSKIESMRFADGVTWLASDIDAMLGQASPGANLDEGSHIAGSQYDDTLTARLNGAVLEGGAGRDLLGVEVNGGIFGVTFNGGRGDDTLTGSYAGDTYVYRRGDGNDVITDHVGTLNSDVADFFERNPNTASYQDLLDFRDIASYEVSVQRPQGTSDLLLSFAGGGTVLVRNWFDGTMLSKMESIQFADGVTWLASDVDAMLGQPSPGATLNEGAHLVGSQYDDTLTASVHGAVLEGGVGHDTLGVAVDGGVFGITFEGGSGHDTINGSYAGDSYVFNRGDGQDVINDDVRSLGNAGVADFFAQNPNTASYQDLLEFRGIASTQVLVSRAGDADLVLSVAGTADEVRIANWFDGSMHAKIEGIQFSDGVTWQASDIDAMLGYSTAGLSLNDGDLLVGSQYDDTLEARLHGAEMRGGAGNDHLAAQVNDGVFAVDFDGGAGNDTMIGSYAGDTYLFDVGDGHDVISDDVRILGNEGVNAYYLAHPEDTAYEDRLVFGAGIDAEDVSYERWGNDMRFNVAGGGSVTVQNWFSGSPYTTIERIEFASGAPAWSGSQLVA